VKGLVVTLLAVGCLVLAPASAPASSAGVPGACKLLTQQSVEGYFHQDMVQTTNKPDACNWQGKVKDTYKGADLVLVTWRLPSNASAAIQGICRPRKGIRQLSLPGATKACGFEAFTGLCVTPPKGESEKDFCQWDVKISFLHGSTTGSIELASLKIYSLNNLNNAAPFARSLLKRWR
jgi:hypothetical protein